MTFSATYILTHSIFCVLSWFNLYKSNRSTKISIFFCHQHLQRLLQANSLHFSLCGRVYTVHSFILITVLQKKMNSSVTEANPSNSVSWRLTKQEFACRFLGSIRIGEIFQLEVWNSSNFVFIFLFTMESMKKFETHTID